MPVMAAKKRTSEGSQPNRSPAWILHARLPVEIGEAFEAYLDSLRPKPSTKAAIELILEEFLTEKGFLPEKGSE